MTLPAPRRRLRVVAAPEHAELQAIVDRLGKAGLSVTTAGSEGFYIESGPFTFDELFEAAAAAVGGLSGQSAGVGRVGEVQAAHPSTAPGRLKVVKP